MTIYRCFSCNKTFPEEKMKSAEVPNNFSVMGTESQNTGMVDQCPHCEATAFLGFSKLNLSPEEETTEQKKFEEWFHSNTFKALCEISST